VGTVLPLSPFPHPQLHLANLLSSNYLALGSGILFAYPQLATITGVQGLVIYAVASAAPLMLFAYLGPIIRRKCPGGFVLTEWTRERFGVVTALFLSFMTLATVFLYMIAELSALQQIMTAMTGLDGLPMIIVEAVVTTIYTCKLFWCSLFLYLWILGDFSMTWQILNLKCMNYFCRQIWNIIVPTSLY
jgi:hypothetical protein